MQPAEQDIEIYQGDTFDLFLRLKKLTAPLTYTYIDLTDAVPKAQVRATADAVGVLAEFTCALSDQVATPGGLLAVLSKVQTAALASTPPDFVWDLEITFANGDVKTILAGKVTVTKQVTRP